MGKRSVKIGTHSKGYAALQREAVNDPTETHDLGLCIFRYPDLPDRPELSNASIKGKRRAARKDDRPSPMRIGSINAVYIEFELEHAAFRADGKERMASTTAADGGFATEFREPMWFAA